MELGGNEYIFDQPLIQWIFITLYSIVFIFCFFGNLAIVLVVTLHWKMRNTTKFCLGNLAVANFCVGIFCVYQNLSIFLMDSWPFGNFMCKMYHFINSLSHTASILILVVICAERYLAILHPFICRRILTIKNLRILIVTVWLISALLSSPRLYYISTYKIRVSGKLGEAPKYDVICGPQRNLYDNQAVDMVYFVLLFLLPLTVMSVLYVRLGIFLQRTASICQQMLCPSEACIHSDCCRDLSASNGLSSSLKNSSRRGRTKKLKHPSRQLPIDPHIPCYQKSFKNSPNISIENSQEGPARESFQHKGNIKSGKKARKSHSRRLEASRNNKLKLKKGMAQHFENSRGQSPRDDYKRRRLSIMKRRKARNANQQLKLSKSRQAVVRMLICVVLTFAFCNLPFHIRKICQNYMANYDFGSQFSYLLTPFTFLMMYANCAINPILCAFMSKSFQESFKDLIQCRLRKEFNRQESTT